MQSEPRETGDLGHFLRAVRRKLQELKEAGGDRWEQAKTDLEGRMAEFEKSVQDIASKAKPS